MFREAVHDAAVGTLAAIIREARTKAGLSQEELGRRTGVSRSAVNQWESAGTAPERDRLPVIARVLALEPGDLLGALDQAPQQDGNIPAKSAFPQADSAKTNVRQVDLPIVAPLRSQMPKDVPVLGTVSGGGGGVIMVGDAIDWARRPPNLEGRPDVFALYVEDVSMVPRYGPGDLVFVEGRPARNGDHVIVEYREVADGEQKAILKLLKATTPTLVRLEQYNPSKTIEIKRSSIVRMRRVLTTMDLLGV